MFFKQKINGRILNYKKCIEIFFPYKEYNICQYENMHIRDVDVDYIHECYCVCYEGLSIEYYIKGITNQFTFEKVYVNRLLNPSEPLIIIYNRHNGKISIAAEW